MSLPVGKDPDEVIKSQGVEYFKELLNNSMDLISYKLFLAKKGVNIGTPDGKLKLIKQAVDILTGVNNEPEIEIHVKKLAAELGVSPQAIKKEVQRRKMANNGYEYKKSQRRDNNKEFSKISPVKGFYKAERKILKLIIENEKIREKIKGQITPRFFTNNNTKKIADVLFEIINKKQNIEISHVFNYLDKEGCAELSTILMEYVELKDEELINALVKKVKEVYFKESIDQVRDQIRKAEILGQREEINDLLNIYQKLKAEMDELNTHTTPGKEGA